jgi:hypothetical protein
VRVRNREDKSMFDLRRVRKFRVCGSVGMTDFDVDGVEALKL